MRAAQIGVLLPAVTQQEPPDTGPQPDAPKSPKRWIVGEPLVSVRWHAASETHRFKHGLDDLEESARLLARRGARPGRRLARAYLNRAHEALHAGRVDLARAALGNER